MDEETASLDSDFTRDRHNNTKRVLIWFALFFVASWAQILPFILVETTRTFLRQYSWIIYIGLLLQFLMLFPFFCCAPLGRHPIDKIWTALIVEATVFTSLPWCAIFEIGTVGIAFGAGVASFFVANLLGKLLKFERSRGYHLAYITIRSIAWVFAVGFVISSNITRLFYLLQAGTAFTFLAVLVELVMFSPMIYYVSVFEDRNFVLITALIMFLIALTMIYALLPWLEAPTVLFDNSKCKWEKKIVI